MKIDMVKMPIVEDVMMARDDVSLHAAFHTQKINAELDMGISNTLLVAPHRCKTY